MKFNELFENYNDASIIVNVRSFSNVSFVNTKETDFYEFKKLNVPLTNWFQLHNQQLMEHEVEWHSPFLQPLLFSQFQFRHLVL